MYGLTLHPEKTRLIEFGRYAASNRAKRGAGRPDAFNFLGFTHHCGRRRSDGDFALRRVSIAKRVRAFLHKVKTELQKRYEWSVARQGSWLRSKVRGYFQTRLLVLLLQQPTPALIRIRRIRGVGVGGVE